MLVSSNRFKVHTSRSGKIVPGTFAPEREPTAIAQIVTCLREFCDPVSQSCKMEC